VAKPHLSDTKPKVQGCVPLLFSAGGVLLAGLLLAIGVVLTSNASFANNYVTTQLTQQQITFPTVDKMSAEEKQQACLVQYAGQQMTTGAQAECYANHYIALHLASMAGGKTYAQLSAASLAQPDNTKLAGQVATVFKGETLRSILLNAFGWWKVSQITYIASLTAFGFGGLTLLASLFGLTVGRRPEIAHEVIDGTPVTRA